MYFRIRGGRAEKRHRLWYRTARIALAATIALGWLAGSLADAQPIAGLRNDAQRLQGQISDTQERIESLAEEFNRTSANAEKATKALADTKTRLGETQRELDGRRSELSEYAVTAYTHAGGQELAGLLGNTPDQAGSRLTYLRSAAGDHKALVDRLRVAGQELSSMQLRQAQAEIDQTANLARVAGLRRDAAQADADLRGLLDRVNGRLGELVREEQQRQAAEAAAQQAAAEAAAAARASAAGREVRFASSPAAAPAPALAVPATPAEPPAAPKPTAAPTPAKAPVGPGAPRASAQTALNAAYSVIGVPYVWAGASPSEGFDCSGLIQWAWAKAGRSLSHAADWQRDETQPISEAELQPGDLVFYGEPPSHNAMYAGNGQIINAPYTGEYIRVQSMYYSSKPMTFGRVN